MTRPRRRPPPKPAETVRRARTLRREMTLPERLLWRVLAARPEGLRFRKQHPAGPYTLDFYCPAARLCIEVDGAAHDMGSAPRHDAERDAWLAAYDIATLRIPAREILTDLAPVLTHIITTAKDRR